MSRDQRYSQSAKGKARDKRREAGEYRQGYKAGYAAARRAYGPKVVGIRKRT